MSLQLYANIYMSIVISFCYVQAKIITDDGKTFKFNIHDPEYAKVFRIIMHILLVM